MLPGLREKSMSYGEKMQKSRSKKTETGHQHGRPGSHMINCSTSRILIYFRYATGYGTEGKATRISWGPELLNTGVGPVQALYYTVLYCTELSLLRNARPIDTRPLLAGSKLKGLLITLPVRTSAVLRSEFSLPCRARREGSGWPAMRRLTTGSS